MYTVVCPLGLNAPPWGTPYNRIHGEVLIHAKGKAFQEHKYIVRSTQNCQGQDVKERVKGVHTSDNSQKAKGLYNLQKAARCVKIFTIYYVYEETPLKRV